MTSRDIIGVQLVIIASGLAFMLVAPFIGMVIDGFRNLFRKFRKN